ncbi:unnamed protein product [Protopolystoma xenopodis]|uniref:Uncharacterized protein n=1 Tax=Protopolystoma xenopodis TaxID=117903 RepID=A0A3S5AN03_9PLAT|nr:unnamed protein product [Protopolystoma xenopodis]
MSYKEAQSNIYALPYEKGPSGVSGGVELSGVRLKILSRSRPGTLVVTARVEASKCDTLAASYGLGPRLDFMRELNGPCYPQDVISAVVPRQAYLLN